MTENRAAEVATDLPIAERRSWDTFREDGMLWLVNRMLHVFGWSIVVVTDDSTGAVADVYPSRSKWRGFTPEADDRGFKRVTAYMKREADALLAEVSDDG